MWAILYKFVKGALVDILYATCSPTSDPHDMERKLDGAYQATASVLSVDPDLPPFGAGASLGLSRLSDLTDCWRQEFLI